MGRQKQKLSDILNKLELTQQDRIDLEYYIKYGKMAFDLNNGNELV